MGQGDVLKLIKEDCWIKSTEIKGLVKSGQSSVNSNLLRLFLNGDVVRRRCDLRYVEYEYKLNVTPE